MAPMKEYERFAPEQLSKPDKTDLYEKLAVAEQQIEDGAEGNDFFSLARQLRGNVHGNSRHTAVGKTVKGVIDRPLGSRYPRYPDMVYPINYGYVEGVMAGDGAEQDVYVFGADSPIETFEGTVIAVYHRLNDVEDKWIVSLDGTNYSDEEIL